MMQYISARLAQDHATPHVVAGSTPVLGFGNFLTARVATLGLNPSKNEFLNRKGQLLTDRRARLVSLQSLGLATFSDASIANREAVLEGCLNYFNGRNVYGWFGRFRPILEALDASYAEGTACHLDLVQTATDPVWSGLTAAVQRHYLAHEAGFFQQQLAEHRIRMVLLNGRTVVETFVAQTGAQLHSSFQRSPCDRAYEFFQGKHRVAGNLIQVRGWNLNLQSSHGITTEFVRSIAEQC
jgi:hypothetical protein